MKKKIISFIMPLCMLFSFTAAPVLVNAQENNKPKTTTSSTEDESETTDDSSKRAGRVAEHKKKLTTALSETVKTRITARCAGAQALVKNKSTVNKTATNARTKAYTTIVSDLEALSSAAIAKGANVETLNAEIAVLETKVVAFTAANTAYQNDLTDLAALDCKTDPTAFQATLQATRTDQATVLEAAKAIKSYLADTVKPTLKALKSQLNGSSDTSTTN